MKYIPNTFELRLAQRLAFLESEYKKNLTKSEPYSEKAEPKKLAECDPDNFENRVITNWSEVHEEEMIQAHDRELQPTKAYACAAAKPKSDFPGVSEILKQEDVVYDKLDEVAMSPKIPFYELASEMLKKEEPSPAGYHIRPIEKGVLGEFSKIKEEFQELEDAMMQQCKILAICEVSDLYGAIELFIESKFGLKMEDIKKMSELTKAAFKSGSRK